MVRSTLQMAKRRQGCHNLRLTPTKTCMNIIFYTVKFIMSSCPSGPAALGSGGAVSSLVNINTHNTSWTTENTYWQIVRLVVVVSIEHRWYIVVVLAVGIYLFAYSYALQPPQVEIVRTGMAYEGLRYKKSDARIQLSGIKCTGSV